MSFIADNNHFALATIMTIPLVRFLQLQLSNRWARATMTLVMILLAASALGSHSRGALLAIGAMALLLWWRSPGKVLGGVVIVLVGIVLVTFMPEHWTARMATIETFQEDRSAMGRIGAWWVSWRVALDYPFGIGFTLARPDLFNLYSPYPDLGVVVAHSIYFQVMGHHGFIGLFLFLLLWAVTWFQAGRIRKHAANFPQARWCVELAGMCQVSLAGYLVGGAFLDLSYFDLPYNIMVLVVLTHVWVKSRAWEREPHSASGRLRIPGVYTGAPAS
jgi:probable O-glycosylation ligase (exosortase A-associated)